MLTCFYEKYRLLIIGAVMKMNKSVEVKDLEGVYTSLVTPMLRNGDVDYLTLEHLVWDQVQAGVNGLVLLDKVGQEALLDRDEKIEVVSSVVEYVNSDVPIVVAVSEKSSQDALEIQNRIDNEIGPTTFLHLLDTPEFKTCYDVYRYLDYVVSGLAPKSNIVLCNTYDALSVNELIDYSKWRNVIGARVSASKNDTDGLYKVISETESSSFRLLCGTDSMAVDSIMCGCYGLVSDSSNVAPKLFVDMMQSALYARKTGDYSEADNKQSEAMLLIESLLDNSCSSIAEILGCEARLPNVKSPVIKQRTITTLDFYGPNNLGFDYREYCKRL